MSVEVGSKCPQNYQGNHEWRQLMDSNEEWQVCPRLIANKDGGGTSYVFYCTYCLGFAHRDRP